MMSKGRSHILTKFLSGTRGIPLRWWPTLLEIYILNEFHQQFQQFLTNWEVESLGVDSLHSCRNLFMVREKKIVYKSEKANHDDFQLLSKSSSEEKHSTSESREFKSCLRLELFHLKVLFAHSTSSSLCWRPTSLNVVDEEKVCRKNKKNCYSSTSPPNSNHLNSAITPFIFLYIEFFKQWISIQ